MTIKQALVRFANNGIGKGEAAHLWLDARTRRADPSPKWLVLKALGTGFFTDVLVLLEGLLFARLSPRIPVTHWGLDSKFGDLSNEDLFSRYFFEPVSGMTVEDIPGCPRGIFPTGWTRRNLKNAHPLSFIRRKNDVTPENYRQLLQALFEVIVIKQHRRPADFIEILRPFLEAEPDFKGKSLFEIYRQLAMQYLIPIAPLRERIDILHESLFAGEPYLAVHIRGSDKIAEVENLEAIQAGYFPLIEKTMAERELKRLLLITEDEHLTAQFQDRFGDRLRITPAQRTRESTMQGLYQDPSAMNYKLGQEAIIDCFLASRSEVFIGSSVSTLALVVGMLKEFDADDLIYLTPREGVLIFDQESYKHIHAIPVPEAGYRMIYT